MQTITIKRYSFDELSPEAKENAIERYRERENSDYPQDLLLDYMEAKAAQLLGVDYFPKDLDLHYSLSYRQGDGVSLSGILYPGHAPALKWPANSYRLNLRRNDNHYTHEYTFNIELLDENFDEIDSGDLLEQLRDVCRKLEKYGYKWDEEYFSDENMAEGARELGDVWTSAGKISDPERD